MKRKHRNIVLFEVLINDPCRLRTRVVCPEKGKGRKTRPRQKKWISIDNYGQ